MNIYMNHLSWNVGKSTDVHVRETFKVLEKEFGDITFYYPKSRLLSLFPNLMRIINGIKHKIFRKCARYDYLLELSHLYNYYEYKKDNYDVVYTQSVFPLGIREKQAVVFDSFLIDPANTEYFCDEQSEVIFNTTLERLRNIVNKNVIINVRSDYSLSLAKEYFPDNFHKFVNIPFILPNLQSLDECHIINKHSGVDCFKLLFVGAQAKRKGIVPLLEALELLFSEGFTNWELYVVSSLDDGDVNIKSELPVHLLGEKPYCEVLELYRHSHFYTMPSFSESFGLSYVEAEANGCIPLVRDFEPQREIIGYGKYGFCAKPEASSVYEALKKMFQLNEEQRKLMAVGCKKNFDDKYSYNVVIKQWHDCFKKAECLNNM